MIKILLVEDELLIANYIKDILEAEKYEVVGIAKDSARAAELFRKHAPDIVCMDIRLKGEISGIQTAKMLRELGDFKLIYLTAFGTKDLVEEAQETRPVGFLVKPVTDQTIIATLTTVAAMSDLTHFNTRPRNRAYVLTLDGGTEVILDISKGTVECCGASYTITSTETKLLHFLIDNHGQVTPASVLRNIIWDDCTVSDASLKTLIWRIRNKLNGIQIIKTVSGFGYVIDAGVKQI